MVRRGHEAVNIPLLHIADPTAQKVKASRVTKVGLLGTAFTMEQDFLQARLRNLFSSMCSAAGNDGVSFMTSSTGMVAGEVLLPKSGQAYARLSPAWSRKAQPSSWLYRDPASHLRETALSLFDTTRFTPSRR